MAIRQRLQSALNRLGEPVGEVRTERPDSLSDTGTPLVNLYLYQLRLNPFMRNNDLEPEVRRTLVPGGGYETQAELVQAWRTPVQLFYLLSAYGDERALVPQRLMAACIATLHRRPLVDARAVASAVAALTGGAAADPPDPVPDDVAIAMQDTALEDSYRLWSAFKATYALSTVYVADTAIVYSAPEPDPVDLVQKLDLRIARGDLQQ